MNKLLKYSFLLLGIPAVFIIAGCSKEIKPENTTLNVSRLFSPIDLESRVVNRTSLRLTWKAVAKATSYDVELFDNGNLDFSGTPVKTLTGINLDQLPLVIPGLEGETDYSVRVKALGEDIDDSKWVSAVFTTDAEQLFSLVDPADLEATAVTLRWQAGETVTQLVITPGDITHPITPQEATDGMATITGLTGETTYTAKIMNGTKVRGTVTFTTLIDLGGAIAIYPEYDMDSLFAAVSDGDVLALLPGEYTVPTITITKSISIRGARPTDKPVLKSTILRVKTGAALTLKDLVLDGTDSDKNQAIVYDDDGNNGPLSVENCVISNYVKGVIYVSKVTMIESVVFNGNIIHDIECDGGDLIDFRKGIAKTFEFTNNTVYNSANTARDLFRMDAGGSDAFPAINSIITIRNNTFNNVSNNSGKRVLYIRLALHEITFTKNILANTEAYYTNNKDINIVNMANNNYFNAPNFTSSTASNAQNDSGVYTTLDPGFADPANGDFTISNEELKFQQIGDPRWIR